MSCYLRHLHGLFQTLGLEYNKPNRSMVDSAIRDSLGMGIGHTCPEVWAAIKALSPDARVELTTSIAERLG